VPKVEWPLTTKRVLTMEFIHGLKINDTNGLKKQGIDVKDAAGLAIGTYSPLSLCWTNEE
jgi:predicted unusual protein kinase regulating ubiquinone biosynthesis (AarF/ABC1/UbiB family)